MRLALVEPARPPDPISQANDLFSADPRPGKINLGIGVYTDASGAVPLMAAVRLAEEALFRRAAPHRYLAIDGLASFTSAARALVLGADSPAISDRRAVSLQTLGGTGALMLAARFVQLARPQAQVFVGVPSWENHRAIFEAAGCTVQSHPYYDTERHAIDFDAMIAVLGRAPRGSAWVLHACCHNPTGMDLSEAQWERLVDLAAARELLPICDLAYQGFGLGLDEDRRVVRRLEARGFEFLVAHSMSKSFALYGERVGSLTAVMASPEQAKVAAATLRRVVRSSYSNPPTQGAALVAEVLNSPELAALWEGELDGMRSRIVSMRARLAEELARLAPSQDMSFTARQRGLFSYTGLTGAEVAQLREGHGIHLLETGRMCVAALNPGNLSAVVEGLGDVLRARPSRPNSTSAAAAAPR